MTVQQWLSDTTAQLTSHGITSGRLDALLLLEDATGHERSWLLAHDELPLTATQQAILTDNLKRRLTHEPMAYIRGHVEFYGRNFEVDKNVLVPRPESESMIELLTKIGHNGIRVADIGTGSGALAITAVLETGAVATAVDIDEACLTVAKRNAVLHSAPLALLQGDLLEPLQSESQQPDLLLCNLPYVPLAYPVNDAARHEPATALYAGNDGLDEYRRLFKQLDSLQTAHVITESLLEQHDSLQALAAKHGYQLQAQLSLAQHFTR